MNNESKRIKRGASIALMALRCEFISGPPLTPKGRGLLSPKQWRLVNRIRCAMFPQWQKDMLSFLGAVQRMNKVDDLYPKTTSA